jgi:hydroxymethylbilane synthase
MAQNFPTINIGTRRSALAQIQARSVEQQLKDAFPDRTYAIHAVLATGDMDKVTPLHQLSQGENAKSLWTGELEAMLESGELDMIVHCLKGEPSALGLHFEIEICSWSHCVYRSLLAVHRCASPALKIQS